MEKVSWKALSSKIKAIYANPTETQNICLKLTEVKMLKIFQGHVNKRDIEFTKNMQSENTGGLEWFWMYMSMLEACMTFKSPKTSQSMRERWNPFNGPFLRNFTRLQLSYWSEKKNLLIKVEHGMMWQNIRVKMTPQKRSRTFWRRRSFFVMRIHRCLYYIKESISWKTRVKDYEKVNYDGSRS